jgi:hypothetical protein
MATPAHTESMPARRVAEPGTANAIDLGWRVAALHALSPSKLSPPAAAHDDLLLNRLSLDAVDRLELDLLAIAGVARSVGAPLADDELEALLDLIPAAASSHDGEERFRGALVRTHIAFEKRMWAKDEGLGRAYELGNFISDTWNRLLRPRTTPDARAELFEIFRSDRVQRMKVLLDNLQTRLDPTAVHVVASHLDAWRDRVAERRETGIPPDVTYDPVERQTII